jgi:hypothetical protein
MIHCLYPKLRALVEQTNITPIVFCNGDGNEFGFKLLYIYANVM